ncbi:integrase catalytic domain-containing protein [Trichonephila clavipes]|nr:integrase catalytic domain-containing protein [Trichonephila clavipes]
MKVFRHTRVVFGVRSSPFLLGAVISVHLSQVPTEQGCVAQKLSKSFYIDNCVTSVDNERELVDFVKCSTKILVDAKMDLSLWTYGPVGEAVRSALDDLNAESTSENIVPVLGIMWDRKGDTLYVESDQWSYVQGPSNPADLSSCGCSPLQFSESVWWSEPCWLKDPEDRWQKLEINPDEILVLSEHRKGINLNVGHGVTAGIDGVKWYERFSVLKNDTNFGLGKGIHKNCQKKVVNQPFLSVDEVQDARGILL